MIEQVKKLGKECLSFIEEEFGITDKELASFNDDQLDDLYDKICDIEVEETINADDGPLSDRGEIATEIVTILGEAYAQYEDDFD